MAAAAIYPKASADPTPASDVEKYLHLHGKDVATAARLTLSDLTETAGISKLCLLYRHKFDANTPHIGYMKADGCYYGPRFMEMNRHEQAFVVAHETLHHSLGHIQSGAILYKREGTDFMPVIYNIAADAIINETLASLPSQRKDASGIANGVESAERFGIVRWKDLAAAAVQIATNSKTKVDPVFAKKATANTSTEIYHALKRSIRQCAARMRLESQGGCDQTDDEEGSNDHDANSAATSQSDQEQNSAANQKAREENIIERLARDLNAHDDLFEAIKSAATAKTEGELRDEVQGNLARLRKMQHGLKPGDVLLKITNFDEAGTSWEAYLRRYMTSSLINTPAFNPNKPSRKTVSAIVDEYTSGRNNPIAFNPRLKRQSPAKKLVAVIDTSGSIFCDQQLVSRFLAEVTAIVKRTSSDCVVILCDVEVQEVILIGDAPQRLKNITPKGGGGTSFVYALEAAEKMNPDCIVYLTDLCGEFPAKKPKAPVIWAYPKMWENMPTPFGKRVPLA